MPTWKVNSYRFYFKVGETLEKHKGIHIHVKAPRGKIDFWIEENGKKSKYKVEVKRIKGIVHDHEQSEIKEIIREKVDFFVEWKKREKNHS
ncbi:MAG: hypothetical protein MRECE_6c016 [Mycoplasmataceae bacterium CE_OT135]|nr:MAG: hypothetical protein MRECE_17c033 [Mycoplasmataceae bacterium CE_OT135]KLL03922.1 MAG: hypothetical protein MRECE_6c016 [Mycoplasmataceae bacterium CE_OT135]